MRIDKFKVKTGKQAYKALTIEEFRDTYHPDIAKETVSYAIKHNRVDYIRPGRERIILLTQNTLNWKPQTHISRKKS